MLLKEITINYHLLSEAISFYIQRGYKQIEVPWVVSKQASMLTAEFTTEVFITDQGEHVVGSAEQGFIQLMMEKSELILSEQRYMAISPCFRRNMENETHAQQFVKLELFAQITASEPIKVMNAMMNDAKEFFEIIHGEKGIEIVPDIKEFTMDLFYKNIELGSYGFRTTKIDENNNLIWVFGTGLALPRTQLIMNDGNVISSMNQTTH